MVLILSATQEEAESVTDYPVLVTGIGTTNCAIALMEYLSTRRPKRIINIGTAGSLGGDSGIFEIHHVYRHDFSSEAIAAVTGKPCPNGISISTSGLFPRARLATGDSFIENSTTRQRLAAHAELVDMEGHVVAVIGQRFGIPVTLLKQVSDQADETARGSWLEAVRAGAPALAAAAEQIVQRDGMF